MAALVTVPPDVLSFTIEAIAVPERKHP